MSAETYGPPPPPSPQVVAELIRELAAGVDEVGAKGADIRRCGEVGRKIQRLRVMYQMHPQALNGHLTRLSELSTRFERVLAERLAEVVDRYHAIGEQLRSVQEEKAYLREFLVRQAGTGGGQLRGARAEARVRAITGRTMPAAGTPARTQLEEVIRTAGVWEAVSQLSRARLQRALDEPSFGGAQHGVLLGLCPLKTTHQVTCQALETRGGGVR